MLYDAHNHLHDARFQGKQDDLIAEMKAVGISGCVVNGTHPDDWGAVSELATRNPEFIKPAFGLHPWRVNDRTADWQEHLLRMLDLHPNASIGECGLDKWISDHDMPAQLECFRLQLSIAAERNLPISIHCLKAWGQLIDVLRNAPLPERGIHIHGFGGSTEVAKELLKLGAYFSFCGYFLQERKKSVQDVFAAIPDDRLLVETDAPDMRLPTELDSYSAAYKINHPGNLAVIVQKLAKIRNTTESTLNRNLLSNFVKYFGTIAQPKK